MAKKNATATDGLTEDSAEQLAERCAAHAPEILEILNALAKDSPDPRGPGAAARALVAKLTA